MSGSHEGMKEMGGREEEVDIFGFQEVHVGVGEKFYSLEGYEMIGGVGEFVKKEEGSVVSMLIRNKWRGRYEVLERCQWRIGVRLDIG